MRLPMLVGERDPIMRAGRRALACLLVGGLLGAAVGVGWLATRTVTYSSTVALELSPVSAAVDLNPTGPGIDDVTVDTDALIIVSDDVAEAVAKTVGGDAEVARKALSVRARPQSRVLEITYTTAISAAAAREGVTTAAETYLDQREQLIIDPVRLYVGQIIKDTAVAQAGDTTAGDTLTRGQSALENRLERAQTYLIRLPQPGLVVAAASEPTSHRGTFGLTVVSAGLLGALIGFGLGLVWERARRSRARAQALATRRATPPVASRQVVVS